MITRHRYKHNLNYLYLKVGSFKVFEDKLAAIMVEELGEDGLKAILSKYEKDEEGYSVPKMNVAIKEGK